MGLNMGKLDFSPLQVTFSLDFSAENKGKRQ